MYRLTKPQKLIYDMHKFAGGGIAVICGSVLVHGEKDLPCLIAAVNAIYRLNDALRIRIEETEEGTRQAVCDFKEQDVETLCFETREQFDAYANIYAIEPLDLYDSLCDIKIVTLNDSYGILVKLHHIVGDAWTLSLLGSQFCTLVNGETPEAYSYTQYIEQEEAYLQSARYQRDRAFFLEQFKECDEVTYLADKQSDSVESRRRTFVMEKAQAARINAYAEKNNTSAFILFMSAFAAYMNRTKMNAERFYIGTAVLNRAGAKEKNTMGMFINSAPILIKIDNEASFAENLAAIQQSSFSVFRHQKYNYGDVLTDIRKEYGFTEKLYDVMLSYQNAAIIGADETFESTWYHSGAQTESLQIHIDDRDSEGVFRIHFDYQVEKFTEAGVEKLYGHFTNLLFDAIEDDSKKLYELKILSEAEKNILLYEFNDTAADYPRDKCVHQLFEEQVQKMPDKTAVIACDQTLTYAELNEQANRIAHGLIEQGVKMGDIVAFALPRKSYLISVMLGILKAGAAYLPVDPGFPEDRICYMLEDSNAKMFITDADIEKLLSCEKMKNPLIQMSSDSLCYCIYTSGSTGRPKGTLLKHKGIVNLVTDLNIYDDISRCERVGLMTTITFDVAAQEIFTALLNGMIGVLGPERKETSFNDIVCFIEANRIDIIYATPTYFDSLTQLAENAEHILGAVKTVVLAGEAFSLNFNVLSCDKKAGVTFENQYGPAETHVATSATLSKYSDVSIGKPVSNTQIYIVDRHMQLMPIGATGELCIAGDGVGAGYLNRPELTAEKFIANPFGKGKLYKTGDLAYWRDDGNIIYVGRNDFQVKIRGLRIELGEIENAICSIPSISQTVVVVRKDDAERKTLCAFYTESLPTPIEQIKKVLREKLPRYMMPHKFIALQEMPLTASGKINRKGLPDIDLKEINRTTEFEHPKGDMERQLVTIMEKVLDYNPIGRNDDFFELGGDSLKAIEFVSKAHGEGIYFALQIIFEHSSVKKLAEYIADKDRQKVVYSGEDFAEFEGMLAKNKETNIGSTLRSDIGNILLTGATGYLGIHILADYLEKDSGTAYCIVRGKNLEESKRRMSDLIKFYFGDKYSQSTRIVVLCADLQKEFFGLSSIEYSMLLEKIDTVVNTAASVKHYGSYQYFHEVNVETIHKLISFCLEANARLVHASTLGVSGNSFGDFFDGYTGKEEKCFCESDLYIEQPLDNVYVRSKFEAEKAIFKAMKKYGLRANIMRMGNLMNRTSDGKFQKNHNTNAFLKRIKAILHLGIFPEYLMNLYVEFTPVDEAAKAVMTIVRYFNDQYTVFHINSTKAYYADKLLEHFRTLGFDMKTVCDNEFKTALRETIKQREMEYIYETFVGDLDENGQLNYDSNIHIENAFTVEYLRRLGFEWSELGIDYLRKYLSYFKNIGYLEGKQNV